MPADAPVGKPDLHWDPVPLAAIRAAQDRLRGVALRTPMVRFDADDELESFR